MASVPPAFFHGLTADELAPWLAPLERRSFAAGAVVLAEGDAPREMYIIERGSLEILLPDRYGRERRIAQLGPGATLGEMALFTGQPASASARATSPLELLVLSESDFQRIAAAFPRIYQNLGAILSQRLAHANRHLHAEHGRVTILRDKQAPPTLGYALACSVAWHTRKPTLLVVLADAIPDELRPLVTHEQSDLLGHARPADSRAYLLVTPPRGAYAPEALHSTLDEISHHYDFVLLQTAGALPALDDREIRLAGAGVVLPDPDDQRPGHSLRAWSSGQRTRPDRQGTLHVAALSAADQQHLPSGLLPASTPGSKALGWAARDIAGLKVGLALGAGSIKGYAHYGVLRVLERIGLEADYITGTSIGAIIAATYALGQSADEAARIMAETSGRAFRPTVPLKSLLSTAGIRKNFAMIGGDLHIEELDLPLAVVAADIMTGQEVIFRRGLLRTAVLASMSIPGIYAPLRVGNHVLVDGGVLNPIPSNVAAEMGADVVVAVSLGSYIAQPVDDVPALETPGALPSLFQTIMRSIEVMQSKISASTAAASTILVEPSFRGITGLGIRGFNQGGRYIRSGEEAAEAALPRLAASLPWLRSSEF